MPHVALTFTNQTFFIIGMKAGETQRIEVSGVVAEDTGLGYFQDVDGDYTPTHLESGFRAGPLFYEEEDAQRYIEAVAPLTDWKRPARDIFLSEDYKATQIKLKEVMLSMVGTYYTARGSLVQRRNADLLEKSRKIALGQ